MQSDFRRAQIRVLVEGSEVEGAVSAETHNNNHFSADRFRIEFAADVVPVQALQLPGARFEIFFGLNGVWKRLIVGLADSVSFDPASGRLDVEGRDLAALMIEAQIDESFLNRTASEIAILFASRHGLAANVDTTTTAVGRYYQAGHDRVSLGQYAKTTTEWDLLALLASREGFDLYMEGVILHFGLPKLDTARILTQSDCLKMQLDHCVTLGRPMSVTVKSWNSKSAEATVATSRSPGIGPQWERTISRPNMSVEDARSLASKTVLDTKRHEWAASVVMPGELELSPRSLVTVAATGTPWDRPYMVSQISRHLDVTGGFVQRMSLQGVV